MQRSDNKSQKTRPIRQDVRYDKTRQDKIR